MVFQSTILILTNLTISSFQSRLKKMASIDGLTGIYNRHAFDIIMNQVIKGAQRKDLDLSIISFDIDHFKKSMMNSVIFCFSLTR